MKISQKNCNPRMARGLAGLPLVLMLSMLAVGVANAAPYKGAASLKKLMAEVLSRCPGAASLAFVPSGSDKAEEALILQQQQIAPMSRDLGAALTCQAVLPGEAEGLLLGLDAVTIAASQTSAGTCTEGLVGGAKFVVEDLNGVPDQHCPGCVSGEYELQDWKDALRLIFLGMPHDAGGDLSKKDCNSDVRHTLAKRWSALFGANCASGTCGQLELHLGLRISAKRQPFC